jgi:hypothetical protein
MIHTMVFMVCVCVLSDNDWLSVGLIKFKWLTVSLLHLKSNVNEQIMNASGIIYDNDSVIM